MFDSDQHPRDSRGRFIRKADASLVKRTVAAEDKRDEISAAVASDDYHDFVEGARGGCAVCGDDESGNDHQDPTAHARVWMDVEGLTLADIDALDALTDILAGDRSGIAPAQAFDTTLAAAQMVADWIGGFLDSEGRSELLQDRDASLAGLRDFASDALTERAENVGRPVTE